jgi:ABC-type transporter Mla subunit MlaD
MSAVRDRISGRVTADRLRLEARRAGRPFVLWLVYLGFGLAAAGYLLAHLHVNLPWQSRYGLRIAVDNAKGVIASDEVRIAGVPVGTVTGVSLVRDQPILGIAINPADGPLYRNAQLRLRPATPLDNMYLDVIDRGTPSAGKVPDGGELSAQHTQTPVDISEIVDVFNADVRPRVTAAIDTLGQGLSDHGAQLRQALVGLAPFLRVARNLAAASMQRATEVRRLVHNLGLITAELNDRNAQVSGLVRGGSATFTALAADSQPLGALIDELPSTLQELPRSFATLRAAADQLNPTADALLPVARALPAGLGALAQISPSLQHALDALHRPLPRLTALLQSAGPLANRLHQAFTALLPQAPQFDRITAAVVPCELQVQDFFQWTLSVLKFADPGGPFPRGDDVVGTDTVGIPDVGLVASRSCAAGGPSR